MAQIKNDEKKSDFFFLFILRFKRIFQIYIEFFLPAATLLKLLSPTKFYALSQKWTVSKNDKF